MVFRSKRDIAVNNEVNKHHAGWCNQLATAVGAAGAIVPLTAAALSFQVTVTTFIGVAFWIFLAIMLHILGAILLRRIRTDDDINSDV
jgi:hypothetical protein